MSNFDNTNRGSIWKNDKKETEKHPDFTGSLNVEGKEYWVSAWKRRPDQNEKAPALSFSVKAKDEQKAQQPANNPAPAQQQAGGFDDFDQDIPF